MTQQRKALLGMHNEYYGASIADALASAGYDVTEVDSVDGMLEKMGVHADSSPDAPPVNHFQKYMMDANLGHAGAASHEPASRIYRHIHADVKNGKIQFLAVSALPTVVQETNEEGIPCKEKVEIYAVLEFIENSS